MPDYRNYGEAVVLPTLQATNMILQQQQRKRQEEAMLNKQVADSLAMYDPSKIRTEDVPGFYDRYNKVRDMSIRYKDAYRNPSKHIDQIRELDQARADLGRYINASKGRMELQKQADTLYTTHGKDLDMDDFMAKRKVLGMPLDQSGDVEIPTSVSDFKLNVNQPDLKKFYEPVYKDNPLTIVSTQSTGPGGEILTSKSRQRDIAGTRESIERLYKSNFANAQKGFQNAFDNTPPEDLDKMTSAMQNIIPGFKVEDPQSFAVASGMIGKMSMDMGQTQSGYTMAAQEAKSRRLQDRAAAISQGQWEKRHAISQADKSSAKSAGKNWVPLMAGAMESEDPEAIGEYITELSDAAPGVEYGYVNSSNYQYDERMQELDRNVATERDMPNSDDVKKGFIWAKVPVGKKKGVTKYKYMIASPSRGDLKPSLNRIMQAARGQKKYGGTLDMESVKPPVGSSSQKSESTKTKTNMPFDFLNDR